MIYGVIYTVENKVNGKIYVGQTTKSFNERYRGDILNTHNEHLRNSIKKYGIENFVIDKCVCECDTKESLDEAEKFYIDFFDAMNPEHGYNKRDGGSNGKHNEESRQKMSESIKKAYENPEYKKKLSEGMKKSHENPEVKKKISEGMKKAYENPEIREKISQNMKRLWQNPEYKKKLSEALKGKGRPFSDEHKKKLSENHANVSGKNHPQARAIVQLDKQNNFIRKWDCINDAAKELNISHINDVCKEKRKFAGGYKWMYLEDYIDLLQYAF